MWDLPVFASGSSDGSGTGPVVDTGSFSVNWPRSMEEMLSAGGGDLVRGTPPVVGDLGSMSVRPWSVCPSSTAVRLGDGGDMLSFVSAVERPMGVLLRRRLCCISYVSLYSVTIGCGASKLFARIGKLSVTSKSNAVA